MKQTILTETQLKFRLVEIYKEEQNKLLEERWDNLLPYEKKFIFEFVKEFSPKNSKILKESRWWNTLGDIVGIFDPTGIVDIINALDYFRQGDNLFGFMSLISAVPYVGDVVGKPIIGILKAGGRASKLIKLAKGSSAWAKLGKQFPIIGKLLEKIGSIGGTLLTILEKAPGGKKFTKVVKDWINMITKASKEYKMIKSGTKLTSTVGKITQSEFKMFRTYGLDSYSGLMRLWKKGGLFKNRQLSRLLVKTKFWLGFLDLVGVANFVGPEELESQMGEEEFNNRMSEYVESPQGKSNWEQEAKEFPEETEIKPTDQTQTAQTTEPEKKSTGDVIGDLINIIGGAKTIGKLI